MRRLDDQWQYQCQSPFKKQWTETLSPNWKMQPKILIVRPYEKQNQKRNRTRQPCRTNTSSAYNTRPNHTQLSSGCIPTPPRALGILTETILQAGFQVYLDLGYGDHCSAYDSKLRTGAAMIPSLSLSFQLTGTIWWFWRFSNQTFTMLAHGQNRPVVTCSLSLVNPFDKATHSNMALVHPT